MSADCFCVPSVNRRDADRIQKASELFDLSFGLPGTNVNVYVSNNSGFNTF